MPAQLGEKPHPFAVKLPFLIRIRFRAELQIITSKRKKKKHAGHARTWPTLRRSYSRVNKKKSISKCISREFDQPSGRYSKFASCVKALPLESRMRFSNPIRYARTKYGKGFCPSGDVRPTSEAYKFPSKSCARVRGAVLMT